MFIVYGKIKCQFCHRAVSLLREKGYDFEYHSMDKKTEELNHLSTIYNWRTVPLIIEIKDGEKNFVGGHDDLIKRMQVEVSEEDDK
tara:strand:+ start:2099 stop:2356 length:258 start_codon:yes stop_codon:yes gene_type:complete